MVPQRVRQNTTRCQRRHRFATATTTGSEGVVPQDLRQTTTGPAVKTLHLYSYCYTTLQLHLTAAKQCLIQHQTCALSAHSLPARTTASCTTTVVESSTAWPQPGSLPPKDATRALLVLYTTRASSPCSQRWTTASSRRCILTYHYCADYHWYQLRSFRASSDRITLLCALPPCYYDQWLAAFALFTDGYDPDLWD